MKTQALNILHKSIGPHGLLASGHAVDNYARVWARDSMMTGIAGLLHNDQPTTDAMRTSLLTLAKHQGKNGQIPSNVSVDVSGKAHVSYGSLVGRVDATTWWIVGTCLYLRYTQDENLTKQLYPAVQRAIEILESWEFNQRHLIYTPLGGNWADEYVTQGYTLYDNVLRLWALEMAAEVFQRHDWAEKAEQVRMVLNKNFGNHPNPKPYHPSAFEKLQNHKPPYPCSALAPNGYDMRWDMAGVSLALLLDVATGNIEGLQQYLKTTASQLGHWMLPVFAPTIYPDDADWNLLSENYSYRFKNEPNHFHNGGSWPIFLGWLGMGLARQEQHDLSLALKNAVANALIAEMPQPFTFYEYWNPLDQTPGGTAELCFSASGALLLDAATEDHYIWKKLLRKASFDKLG